MEDCSILSNKKHADPMTAVDVTYPLPSVDSFMLGENIDGCSFRRTPTQANKTCHENAGQCCASHKSIYLQLHWRMASFVGRSLLTNSIFLLTVYIVGKWLGMRCDRSLKIDGPKICGEHLQLLHKPQERNWFSILGSQTIG